MHILLKDLPSASRHELVELLEDATPIATWDWHLADNSFFWSPRQFGHLGMQTVPPGEIRCEKWLDTIHPADRAMVQAGTAKAIATGEPLDLTFRVLWRDKAAAVPVDVRWLHSRGRLVRAQDGSPLRLLGISCDITEAEQARAVASARRDAQLADKFGGPTRFDVYVESSRDWLFQLRVDGDSRFTYQMINPVGLTAINMTMAAVHGLTPIDVLGPDDGQKLVAALKSVLETGLPVRAEQIISQGGRTVSYDAIYMPIRDEHGDVRAILGRGRDITQEKQLQAALQQSQKMERLGQLAAGIAHDFNNLLASFSACFRLLRRSPLSPDAESVLEMGSHALEQGEALTRQLLTFAHRQSVVTGSFQLNDCVVNMMRIVRLSLPGVTVITDLTAERCNVVASAGLIEACLLNLCINARDARPVGCEIVITTALIDTSEPIGDLPPGHFAKLSVGDNGPGMSPDVLRRAFDPFFTTKPAGLGTGLGLSTVYGTARSLGGAVTIDSIEGRGTTVTIFLCRTSS